MNDRLDGDLFASTAWQFPGFLQVLQIQVQGLTRPFPKPRLMNGESRVAVETMTTS